MTAKAFRFRIIMTIAMTAESMGMCILSTPTLISTSMRVMSLNVMVTTHRNIKDAFHWHRNLRSRVSGRNCSSSGHSVPHLYNSIRHQLVSINVNRAISWLSSNSNRTIYRIINNLVNPVN